MLAPELLLPAIADRDDDSGNAGDRHELDYAGLGDRRRLQRVRARGKKAEQYNGDGRMHFHGRRAPDNVTVRHVRHGGQRLQARTVNVLFLPSNQAFNPAQRKGRKAVVREVDTGAAHNDA